MPSDGYISGIDYTNYFYRFIGPRYLDFVLATSRIMPPRRGHAKTYCELGCGFGVSLCINAAANPDMSFVGVDYNPIHIAHARDLAERAGLKNITFEAASFQELVERPADGLPRFDYITLHGVYSWVSAANRQWIVSFIDRHLETGGAVYVSYNTMPGAIWRTNLTRLAREHAARSSGSTEQRTMAAIGFLAEMADKKAAWFHNTNRVSKRVKALKNRNVRYLAHEFLAGDSEALFHSDVAADMDRARLQYVCSAKPTEDMDHWHIKAPLRRIVDSATDSAWRETIKDFATNNQFRWDVFVRGPMRLTPRQATDLTAAFGVALLDAPDVVPRTYSGMLGVVPTDPALYDMIVSMLADGPSAVGRVVEAGLAAGHAATAMIEALRVLVDRGHVAPMPLVQGRSSDAVNRLNRALSDLVLEGTDQWALALAGTGGGVGADPEHILAWRAVADAPADGPEAWISGVEEQVRRYIANRPDILEGEREARRDSMMKKVEEFMKGPFAHLVRAGILAPPAPVEDASAGNVRADLRIRR